MQRGLRVHDNFTRGNRGKSNIAIAILEKWMIISYLVVAIIFSPTVHNSLGKIFIIKKTAFGIDSNYLLWRINNYSV